ncbi:MAG TPA: hypothetical protein VL400_25955 [Polyangiaceae bacterium]|nr:hypothetical protein [Polyangiaceae bacterium]
MSSAKKHPPKDGLLPKELAESWGKIGYGLGAIGLLAFLAGFFGANHARFGGAYLTGFVFTFTIAIGALFMTVIQHLTKAGWSVGPRRLMEWMSQALIACVLLFVPLLAMSHDVWNHWMGEHAAHDPVLIKKAAYLNPTFFYVRTVVYLLTWALLAMWFYKLSREQDTSGDRELSTRRESAAAPATAALGLTVTFAGFDWVMSLDPHWYSTIFGVYIFAGSLVSSMAMLSLVIVRLRKAGVGGALLTVEHQHDVGKFLHGFIIFWAYIGFSQLILIYYANIPEETIFYKHRWEHGWSSWSLLLFLGHFVAPFLILLSRHAKRSATGLTIGAGLIVVMHYVDVYWMVMPNFQEHFSFQWVDIAGLLAPFGLACGFVAYRVLGHPAIPMKDPYIPEAMKAENL